MMAFNSIIKNNINLHLIINKTWNLKAKIIFMKKNKFKILNYKHRLLRISIKKSIIIIP